MSPSVCTCRQHVYVWTGSLHFCVYRQHAPFCIHTGNLYFVCTDTMCLCVYRQPIFCVYRQYVSLCTANMCLCVYSQHVCLCVQPTCVFLCTGNMRLGLTQHCQIIHRRPEICIWPQLPAEWTLAFLCIVGGIICLTTTCVLLLLSHWHRRAAKYVRWVALFASECLLFSSLFVGF